MPPKRAKQPTTTANAIPAPEQAHTPEQSLAKKSIGITQAQKQALVDNLQLEITERARKLRAQYALQAQSLRSRLEMRVNRIPAALRKRKMGDLFEEYAPKPQPPQDAIALEKESDRKSLKRTSDQISTASPNLEVEVEDKENTQPSHGDLANPKKRAKTTTTAAQANTKATRTTSRKVLQPSTSTVLSPKSHNSRTLPKSPFKTASPEKATSTIGFIRPSSPAKPTPPAPVQRGGARTASRQQNTITAAAKKRNAARAENEPEGRDSEASTTSTGTTTTVVTKAVGAGAGKGRAGAATAAAKKAAGAATKKVTAAAARKENVPPPPTVAAGTGRSLRKRG